MAGERSSFGLPGRAWNAAKINMNSNVVSRYGAIVESDTLKTLGDFLIDIDKVVEMSGVDNERKSDDRLKKYNVVKIIPTKRLAETENPLEMYLITDEHGHDIGIYEITEKGPKFRLAPKIKDNNDEIMRKFKGKEEIAILKEQYEIDTLEKLVDKLSKDEDIALSSEEQARDSVKKKRIERGDNFENNENEQSQEEIAALAKIPADMRGEAIEFARKNNLQIKDMLIIEDPDELTEIIDNRQNQIKKNAGPVILIRTKSGRADNLGDDVYAMQNGVVIQNEANDQILGNFMDNHKDENKVHSVEPEDNNLISEEDAQSLENENIKKAKEAQEILQTDEFIRKFEEIKKEIKEHEAEIERLQQEIESGEENDNIEEKQEEIEQHESAIEKKTEELDSYYRELGNRNKDINENNTGNEKVRGELPTSIYDGH